MSNRDATCSGAGIERALVGTVFRRMLELPPDAAHADAADIVFSEVREAHPWIETILMAASIWVTAPSPRTPLDWP